MNTHNIEHYYKHIQRKYSINVIWTYLLSCIASDIFWARIFILLFYIAYFQFIVFIVLVKSQNLVIRCM